MTGALVVITFCATLLQASGRYIGSLWVPGGTCCSRVGVARLAKERYEDRVQELDALWDEARTKNVTVQKLEMLLPELKKILQRRLLPVF